MRLGLIVAGGYSTRFGDDDKAFADIGGRPMVRHVAERIAPAIDALVVNCRDDQHDGMVGAFDGFGHPVRYAIDEDEGVGPVAGIATGLTVAPEGASSTFIVACDMPLVEPSFVSFLFDEMDATGREAVVPRSGDGYHQVLHAVYRTRSMADACERALEEGQRRMLAPLEYLDAEVLDPAAFEGVGSPASFWNVNTPEELDQARVRLNGGTEG